MKWVLGTTTTAERATGMEGMQAWLGGGNLMVILVLSIANSMTFFYPFVQTLVLGVLAVVAYPVLNTFFHFADPRGSRDAGRQRVLSLLEQGRINAEECAILLRELDSERDRREGGRRLWPDLEHPGKLALVTALLVAFGFLVSWLLR